MCIIESTHSDQQMDLREMLFITDTFQRQSWLSSVQFTRLQGVQTSC